MSQCCSWSASVSSRSRPALITSTGPLTLTSSRPTSATSAASQNWFLVGNCTSSPGFRTPSRRQDGGGSENRFQCPHGTVSWTPRGCLTHVSRWDGDLGCLLDRSLLFRRNTNCFPASPEKKCGTPTPRYLRYFSLIYRI